MLYKLCLVSLVLIVVTDATIVAPSLVILRRTPGSPFYEQGNKPESIYKKPKYNKNFHKTPLLLGKYAAKLAVESYKEQAKKPLVDIGKKTPDYDQSTPAVYPAYEAEMEYYDETTVPYQQFADFAVPKGMEMARGLFPLGWKIGDYAAPIVLKRLKKKKNDDSDDESPPPPPPTPPANKKPPPNNNPSSNQSPPSNQNPTNQKPPNKNPADGNPADRNPADGNPATDSPAQGNPNYDYPGNYGG